MEKALKKKLSRTRAYRERLGGTSGLRPGLKLIWSEVESSRNGVVALNDYRFKTMPYDHQRAIFMTSRDRQSYALFMDMGTGKSKVVIDNACYLFGRGLINGMLIVAPKGVYGNWISTQFPTHTPDNVLSSSVIVRWQASHTKRWLEDYARLYKPDPLSLHVLVINIEAVNTEAGEEACVKFLRAHRCMMVVDESTTIKHHTTKWTKKVIKLGRSATFRRILTGTPITNGPLDAYSQFEFLDPDILGQGSFFAFRNRYAITRKRRVNTHAFIEVVGYQRLDELQELMRKAAVFVRKEDCLDLPEKIYSRREVQMSPRQKKLYEDLRTKCIAELEGIGTVTAEMALTRLLRLHQISCGFVSTDEMVPTLETDGTEEEVEDPVFHRKIEIIDPEGGPRVRELLSILDEMSGKVIIWANYTFSINTILDAIRKKYGRDSAEVYSGMTKQEDRGEIVKNFQDPNSELRFFIGQTRTGGYGLTLTAASNVVYFSNDYSLEVRLQSEDRAHRIGQRRSVTYVDLVCPGTIDEKILDVLTKKKNLADQVIGTGWKNFI